MKDQNVSDLLAGMFPAPLPTVWEKGTTMDFRSFFKPAGTNPEIKGPYYELSSFALILGHSNFEALTLGFKKGSSVTEMTFRPIDPTKPIVLAVDDMSDIGFVCIDHHLKEGAKAGMRNYGMYKTDDFIIDCQSANSSETGQGYYSITSGGLTFISSSTAFSDTWAVKDCDLLCAFVAGELTVNQLRMHAFLTDREAVKEERREAHIKHLAKELSGALEEGSFALVKLERLNERLRLYEKMVSELKSAMNGVFPFIGKSNVLKVIEDNN